MTPFALTDIFNHSTVEVLDYSIFNSSLSQLKFDTKCLISTVNQYSYMVAEKDEDFKKALIGSDILLPDGIGIVAAAKMLNGETVKKIAGADIHQHLLQKLNLEGGSCFYLGATEITLAAIRKRMAKEYPQVKVATFSPAYKAEFNAAEDAEMIAAVNQFNPDVLFIGMTAPKQEKWAFKYKNKLDATIICPIGAVFDFYAETITRPSEFWINLGLEWAVRLVKEPKRMAKRYLYYGPAFVYELFKAKITHPFVKNSVDQRHIIA
ncbi:WecB/TagA/CpsF family glycosyltransferase [Mucilaginibacter sp. UR6-11]|uniref:WecB/TagA/CpsF family glycosyltransferase n=1 Tax=Mucilaginibacter sp. UR6-11 TaxID=1435644 RepID=UPI001E48E10B|nr:WecB/TagA/CpsF family glycosyltransferase [Mucilaginibacter sp. UR6-11]MCC8426188.1 WecB/TagA/CpsF family glycosyltransferase [Mucilaginibacter sp. UR6-11]